MWSRLPFYCWPLAWMSLWQHGAATTWALMSSAEVPRLPSLRLRTPLLTLHVSTLRLRQHAEPSGYEMHRPNLHLVHPNAAPRADLHH